MSVPQKEKEGPAKMLRAMFAGVGSLLSVMDKVRSKPAAEAPADAEVPAPTAVAPEAAAPEAAAPEAAAAPEPAAEPETVAAETAAPETATPETVAPEAAAELPLANYDELTVASLRARLRNLSIDQLTQLIAYERANAARPDVITMFERRIAKVEAEA
jgi:hypothetical protein